MLNFVKLFSRIQYRICIARFKQNCFSRAAFWAAFRTAAVQQPDEKLYMDSFQSNAQSSVLQRLSTRVCKYFRPESLLGLSE